MKKTIIKLTSFVMALAMLFSISAVPAFAASAVTRTNVSYSAVKCNATDGALPSGKTTVNVGDKIYFNIQVDSSQKLKTVELYVKPVGASKYTKYTETATNYMRYAYFPYTVSGSAGTMSYYFKTIGTSGSTKTTTTASITVKKAATTPTTSYKQSTVEITKVGQVVDTFNGVQAKYRPCNYDDAQDSVYSCAAYVKRYYSTIYGVSVSSLQTGKTPVVNKGTIKKTTSPKPGDIGYHTNSGSGHWFIVKAVNSDGSYTIIEQNTKWKSNGKSYTYVNHKITKSFTNLKFFTWSK